MPVGAFKLIGINELQNFQKKYQIFICLRIRGLVLFGLNDEKFLKNILVKNLVVSIFCYNFALAIGNDTESK